MINLNKQENESDLQYMWRICSAKDRGTLDKTWTEVAEILNIGLGYDEDSWLSESAYRKKYQAAKAFNDQVFSQMESDAYLEKLAMQERELKKARTKLQTEKLEYNKWLREEARDEMIMEKIINAVNNLEPIDIPDNIDMEISRNGKSYCLIMGDEHYGTEFALKDMFGSVINSYSPEIFEERMWNLYSKVLDIINHNNVTHLYIFNMGDFSDGCLRVSQLMKLRYGVVDGTIKYANFMATWYNKLSAHVNITLQMCDGNHTELRQLGQPKGTFTEDNMGKVVREILKARLEDNPNFKLIENPSGMIYQVMSGWTVVGLHGEVKNMRTALLELSKIYGIDINYLLAGHLHHSRTEEVAADCEVINIPSIIGIDSYSLSLRKTSNAGAKFLVFGASGLELEYKIKLN